ncbi:MAG: hypothetical protein ACTSVI_13665, partial [Promethearchaeota archaeon]
MKMITAIFDTNFFIGIKTVVNDVNDLFSFLDGLIQSFKENNIHGIIPFRVLGEIERFDAKLARYLELHFQVYPPVDTEANIFFLNIKFQNRHRPKKNRWFHVSEVTDLAVITVAKEIFDAQFKEQDKEKLIDREIWIVSNDEGIQKATMHFLEAKVKVMESATFLSYLLGVSNMKDFQDAIESLSKKVFVYFTTYRSLEGREPVSQLNNFYSEMLNAIRMAREDIRGNFDEFVIKRFENFLVRGDSLRKPLLIYEKCLKNLKKILDLDRNGYKSRLDILVNSLNISLFNLSRALDEPSNFKRFYNYIAIYLINIFLNAFNIHFMDHEFELSWRRLEIAKIITQALLDQEKMHGTRMMILLLEIIFIEITSHLPNQYLDDCIEHVVDLVNRDGYPSFVPADMINLAVVLYYFKMKKEYIEIADGNKARYSEKLFHDSMQSLGEDGCRQCFLSKDKLLVTADYFKAFEYILEDFCDEIISLGNHELALSMYETILQYLPRDSDEHERIRGKIYLTMLIMNSPPRDFIDKGFSQGWEKTSLPLEPDLQHLEFTRIEDISPVYRKRIKILRMIDETEQHYFFHCWIYPIKSRFLIKVPKNVNIIKPGLLKELKLI